MTSVGLAQPAPTPVPLAFEEDAVAIEYAGQWRLVWRRFRRHKLGLVGLVLLLAIAIACGLAPWIAPYPFDKQDPLLIQAFPGPSPQHWLGTDELGRDVLSRLMYAGRVSLLVSLVSTFISIGIGMLVGAVAA